MHPASEKTKKTAEIEQYTGNQQDFADKPAVARHHVRQAVFVQQARFAHLQRFSALLFARVCRGVFIRLPLCQSLRTCS